jgi:hypothetical protein
VALGKITMPITFGYVHNTRTEQVVFDIVDMEYPYNAIIGRGTLNAFKAILHLAYLCMKIPSNQDVAEPPKLLGPHAPVLVSKTSDSYACALNNLTGSIRVSQGHRINHLQPEPRD